MQSYGELAAANEKLRGENTALAQERDFGIAVLDAVSQPLVVLDRESRLLKVNQAFCRTFQVSQPESEGRLLYSLSRGAWDSPALRASVDGLIQGGGSFADLAIEMDLQDAGRKSLLFGGCRIDGLNGILVSVDDVTERRKAEGALRQQNDRAFEARQTEAIGRLAGAVAHEVNNLLTGIIGYSSLLLEALDGNEQAIEQVGAIRTAGDRAASFTQQLLAFGRCQTLQPEAVDLNGIVTKLEGILRSLAGERITLVIDTAPALQRVRADPTETGRTILNLFLNAKEAIREAGGTVTIQTANVRLTEEEARQQGLPPGDFVTLAVRDTGAAMDAERQARVFEPFVTAERNGDGNGLGLGLAAIQGFVEQSGGAVRCASEPGLGTTFRILLPELADSADKLAGQVAGPSAKSRKAETVLLVDDEAPIRMLVRTILEDDGYVVLEARHGGEGLAMCESREGPIDLLITDVVMPELGGRELAEVALKMRPDLRVVFMSGYANNMTLKLGPGNGMRFLQKPFTPIELRRKVREVLDEETKPVPQSSSTSPIWRIPWNNVT